MTKELRQLSAGPRAEADRPLSAKGGHEVTTAKAIRTNCANATARLALSPRYCRNARIQRLKSHGPPPNGPDTRLDDHSRPPPSRLPTRKDIPDIARRLAVARNSPCPLHSSRPRIVRGEREMNDAEPVEHLS